MKHLLLAACLFAAAPAVAQKRAPITESEQLFKGTNAILIKAPENGAEAIRKLAEVAKAQGYSIDSLTEIKLVTSPRQYEFKKNGIITPCLHRFRAVAAGSDILLTGTIRVQLNITQQFEGGMGWYGEKDESQGKSCLAQAQKLALAYPGAKVLYAKMP